MASEWARGKVERIIKLAECIHEDDCEGPYGEEPCDCWVAEVRQEIAAALDDARREGAERERDEAIDERDVLMEAHQALGREYEMQGRKLDKLQADLDAALDWIDTHPSRRSLDVMRALLEKRRKRG